MANIYNDPRITKVIDEGYEINVSSYFGKAWELVKKNLGLFVGYTLVYFLISVVLALIPFIGSIASLVISPSLMIGYYIVADKLHRNEQATFNNFFDGFSKLGDLFLVYLVYCLFIIGGLLLLIIPGIYLAVAYAFALPLVWFMYNGSVLDTLKTSRIIVSKQWFSFLGFYILAFLIALLGLICLGAGIVIAIPVISVAQYYLFADIVGVDAKPQDDPFDHLVSEQEQ